MSIEKTNFDDITETDLQELKNNSISEGLRIDFKRDMYGNSDSDKKELLKDVSAFANSHGGHLVIGVGESEGVATDIPGLEIDPDSVVSSLQQTINTGIDPRIPGVRIRAIPIQDNKHVIVIRVPHSWNPPHRTDYRGSRKFWIRNSSGAHEADMDELRNMFTLSSGAIEKIRAFRLQRINEIKAMSGARPLENNGRLIIHIVPLSAFTSTEQIDLTEARIRHQHFNPISVNSGIPFFNFEGFINERSGEGNKGYTQVFRNGVIEATKANIVRDRDGFRSISGINIEQSISDALPNYIEGLKQLNVSPPLVIMITLENVQQVTYAIVRGVLDDNPPQFDRPDYPLPECILEEYGSTEDYHRCVKPAFDALWNALGDPQARFFNSEGVWDVPK